MDKDKPHFFIADKLKWMAHGSFVQPLCPVHSMPLQPIQDKYCFETNAHNASHTLWCDDCQKSYPIPRNIKREKEFAFNKMSASIIRNQRFINLDDEAIPIAEHKLKNNSDYFITSVLTQSKVGLRLIVYAGKKGSDQKAQIFIEPEIKRLAFDQTNLHPNDVFTIVEAIFKDGSKASIES